MHLCLAEMTEILGSGGLVGIGDDRATGVGAGELVKGSAVDGFAFARKIAGLAIAPHLVARQPSHLIAEGIARDTPPSFTHRVPVNA